MKSYFYFSCAAHGLMLATLLVVGTLLSKPRMSYYAVDLMSSSPAGGGLTPGPTVPPVAAPVHQVTKVSVPKLAPPAPRAAEEELPDRDTIRMPAKLKKKRLTQKASQSRSESEESRGSSENAAPPQSAGHGGTGVPGSGSGIMGA